MNFIEAVQNLKNGECKKIQSSSGLILKQSSHASNIGGCLVQNDGYCPFLHPEHILDNWEMLETRPKVKRRELIQIQHAMSVVSAPDCLTGIPSTCKFYAEWEE